MNAIRVVHIVCTDEFAGVERYVSTISVALAQRGSDVTVLGGDESQMRLLLEGTGVSWSPAPTVASAVARLWSLGRVDIVHAHMFDAELAAALGAVRCRAPIVATRHFAAHRGSSPGAQLVGRVLTRVVVEQLAISEFVASSIEGSSAVINPGVRDIESCVAGEPRRKQVLLVQRLEAEKRTGVGLRAFAQSGLASRGWLLVVAGRGAEEAELRSLSDRLGIAHACRFLGRQSDVDVLYRQASIFLAPAVDEPFGISVVEAMAHALPVVAVASGGHFETVGLSAEARLFPPDDAAAAARLLSELAGDATARSRYGGLLRDIQRRQFTVAQQVERTLEIYRSVVDRVS